MANKEINLAGLHYIIKESYGNKFLNYAKGQKFDIPNNLIKEVEKFAYGLEGDARLDVMAFVVQADEVASKIVEDFPKGSVARLHENTGKKFIPFYMFTYMLHNAMGIDSEEIDAKQIVLEIRAYINGLTSQ